MSAHPNVILMASLEPDGLSRKTMRAILDENEIEPGDWLKIGELDCNTAVMESDYLESWQISAKEGNLVFFDMVTYGYGETITWQKLQEHKSNLEKWAQETCKKHKCSYEIIITANYW